ncbi:MAG: hypothetical protein QME68_02600, partial [Elusimicrobiota bacterium]|nr:hypothetical protein [Elusimicrobiota bacterium]
TQSAVLLISQATHYWRIKTEDNASNYQLSTINYTLLIDTTPPSVPVLSTPIDDYTTNQLNITFQWSACDDTDWRGGSG